METVRTRKPSKMKNHKTGGYDSKREAKRAQELKFMQMDGQISELREQVKFELVPSQKLGGKVVERAVTYTADFVYRDKTGAVVVEDSKGFKTQQYVIRRKLMLYVHGIRVREV